MKLEKGHLELVNKEFEKIRKFKHNVLDYSSKYYGGDIINLILLYTVYLFDSYDFCISNQISMENWEEFYKLLEDCLGQEQEYIGDLLFDKYGMAQ